MFQVGTASHHLEHCPVGDIVAPGHLQTAQLGAALGQHVQPAVGQSLAAVDHHRLQRQTHVGGVLAQPVGEHPDGAVGVKELPREPHTDPQPGVPRQVVPAATDACAAAQLVGGKAGEDLQQGVVGEEVDGGEVVGFGLSGAGVAARLRVDHRHRLGRSRR